MSAVDFIFMCKEHLLKSVWNHRASRGLDYAGRAAWRLLMFILSLVVF